MTVSELRKYIKHYLESFDDDSDAAVDRIDETVEVIRDIKEAAIELNLPRMAEVCASCQGAVPGTAYGTDSALRVPRLAPREARYTHTTSSGQKAGRKSRQGAVMDSVGRVVRRKCDHQAEWTAEVSDCPCRLGSLQKSADSATAGEKETGETFREGVRLSHCGHTLQP